MMLAAPCPAFPAVRVMHAHGSTNNVKESFRTGKIIANAAPVMVGAGRCKDCSRAVCLSDTDHFFCNNIQCFIPADPFITGNASVFIVTVSIRIEINSFHWVKTAVWRIDHLFPPLCIRCNCRTTRRCQFLSLCGDRPHIRIFFIKVDRCYADDFVIFNVNK